MQADAQLDVDRLVAMGNTGKKGRREDLISRGKMSKLELFTPPYNLLTIMEFAKDDNGDPWVPSRRISLVYVPLISLALGVFCELTVHGLSDFEWRGIILPLLVALAGYYLFALPLLVWNRQIKIKHRERTKTD